VPIPLTYTQTEGTFEAFLEALPESELLMLSQMDFHMGFYSIHHHCLVTCQMSIGANNGSVVTDKGA
jgi:hypothetical protein